MTWLLRVTLISTARCSLSLSSVSIHRPLPINRFYMLCRSLHISSTCPNVQKNDKNVSAKIIKIFLPSKCCNTRKTKVLKQKTLKNHDFSQKYRKTEINKVQPIDLYTLIVAYALVTKSINKKKLHQIKPVDW